jgi:hypothetical protein
VPCAPHLLDHLDHALLFARLGLDDLADRARVNLAHRVGGGRERLGVDEGDAGAADAALVIHEPFGQVCTRGQGG